MVLSSYRIAQWL
ncbi:hypothetical protein D018_4971A, partial [Vibrio parahaemolyticus VP2007-007]